MVVNGLFFTLCNNWYLTVSLVSSSLFSNLLVSSVSLVSDSSKVSACICSEYSYNCFSGYHWPTYTPASTSCK